MNGQNFENIQLTKAMEILRNNTHLSITVKTNLFGKFVCIICSSFDRDLDFFNSLKLFCLKCFCTRENRTRKHKGPKIHLGFIIAKKNL